MMQKFQTLFLVFLFFVFLFFPLSWQTGTKHTMSKKQNKLFTIIAKQNSERSHQGWPKHKLHARSDQQAWAREGIGSQGADLFHHVVPSFGPASASIISSQVNFIYSSASSRGSTPPSVFHCSHAHLVRPRSWSSDLLQQILTMIQIISTRSKQFSIIAVNSSQRMFIRWHVHK